MLLKVLIVTLTLASLVVLALMWRLLQLRRRQDMLRSKEAELRQDLDLRLAPLDDPEAPR